MILRVINEKNGEYEDIECVGFNLQYVTATGNGKIQCRRKLNNGKYGLKHWIKNEFYSPIALKIKERFKQEIPSFADINIDKILFIEDIDFVGDEINKNKDWVMKIKKAPAQLTELTGYQYIIESREFWVKRISNEQVTAHLYSVLKQIEDGKIVEPDVKQWKELLGTLGYGWGTTMSPVANILDELDLEEEDFKMLKKADLQLRFDLKNIK